MMVDELNGNGQNLLPWPLTTVLEGMVSGLPDQGVKLTDNGDGTGTKSRSPADRSVQGRATRPPWEVEPTGIGDSGPMGMFGMLNLGLVTSEEEIIPWSYYPYLRDMQLRKLAQTEPIMASALYSLTARMGALRYVVTGGRNQKKYFQDVFANAGFGRGWTEEIKKFVYDLLTQDNGGFLELVGAGRPEGALVGPVQAIAHIDSSRCWRTFDPDYPVVYHNPYEATWHKLHRTRVLMASNNPMPDELGRGIGFCAVSRAMKLIQYMRDVIVYKHEKVGGRFTRALGFGNGITPKQFNAAIQAARENSDNKGLTRFMEIPFLLSQNETMNLDLLNLAALPDGFDSEKDTTLYVYCIALAFGVDAREFWPATMSGATKADAAVQHLKARGKGIGDLIQTIERAINWQILPQGVEFHFDFVDDEADKEKTEIHKVRMNIIQQGISMRMITPAQGLVVALDDGIFDARILTQPEAPNIADDSAPVTPEEDEMIQEAVDVTEEALAEQQALEDERLAAQQEQAAAAGPAARVRPGIKPAQGQNGARPVPKRVNPAVGTNAQLKKALNEVAPFTEQELDALFAAFQKLPDLKELEKRISKSKASPERASDARPTELL